MIEPYCFDQIFCMGVLYYDGDCDFLGYHFVAKVPPPCLEIVLNIIVRSFVIAHFFMSLIPW
jgi:hypothetical protein